MNKQSQYAVSEQNLIRFQYLLLQRILLSISILSLVIASASLVEFYPLNDTYMLLLYIYSLSMFILYYLHITLPKYYVHYVQGAIFSSLFILLIMTTTVWIDAFRLVWFFLVVFAAFMLQGRYYGMMISLVTVLLVTVLFFLFDLHLNSYTFITFIVSLSAFTLFSYYFISKLQLDEAHFKHRVHEEVQKRQSQEQLLLRQYRMQTMGEMIDAIAHQWRQPLMQSNMLLLNMEEELDNQTYLAEKMQELISLNTHMSQTIDDFRHLLHDSKHKMVFNIQESIDEVLALMHHQLKEIDVVSQCSNNHEVLGYKNEFIQVLIILLSNAVEALTVKKIEDRNITILTTLDDTNVIMEIEDNAGGIEEQVIDKIFDPYFSTKQNTSGTGLGLYIAKLITVETMHGSLYVSQGTEGAKFTVTFKKTL